MDNANIASELVGRVALVTGSARNIGRAIALNLARAGASVMVTANSDLAGVEETVDLITKAGGNADCLLGDIRDQAAVNRVVSRAVERFGRLDILVNNAAVRREENFEAITFESWREITSIILDGNFLYTHAAIAHLLGSDAGRIINMGGRTGFTGAKNRAHVVAAKSALIGMTKALAQEFAGKLTVNMVSPGQIDTVRGASAARAVHAHEVAPVGRKGSVDEVAGIIGMLAGPRGGFLTGQAIHVNGGEYMP